MYLYKIAATYSVCHTQPIFKTEPKLRRRCNEVSTRLATEFLKMTNTVGWPSNKLYKYGNEKLLTMVSDHSENLTSKENDNIT